MNERICATALYYLDSENVTPSHLAFRMQTSYYQDELQGIAGQDAYNWLERVYGTALGPAGYQMNACLQSYGSVETREGRMLAFPNILYVPHAPSSFFEPERSPEEALLRNVELISVTYYYAANTAFLPSSFRIQPSQVTDASSRSGSSTRTTASFPLPMYRRSSWTGGPRLSSVLRNGPSAATCPVRSSSWCWRKG
jgi:hypothetical protein